MSCVLTVFGMGAGAAASAGGGDGRIDAAGGCVGVNEPIFGCAPAGTAVVVGASYGCSSVSHFLRRACPSCAFSKSQSLVLPTSNCLLTRSRRISRFAFGVMFGPMLLPWMNDKPKF